MSRLVITRKFDEGFTFHTSDGDVHVLVERPKGSGAKLVIDAPRGIDIVRDELLQQPRVRHEELKGGRG